MLHIALEQPGQIEVRITPQTASATNPSTAPPTNARPGRGLKRM